MSVAVVSVRGKSVKRDAGNVNATVTPQAPVPALVPPALPPVVEVVASPFPI